MRVGAHLYTYPPTRLLGAELMTSELLEALAARGHECQVATVADVKDYRRNGVAVSARLINLLSSPDDRFDVFITHPELAEFNHDRARGCGAKIVHVVHNLRDETIKGVLNQPADLVIANGVETQRVLATHGVDSVIIRPPTKLLRAPDAARIEPTFTTLINLSPAKGGHVLAEVAEALRGADFLGIVGGYSEQVLDQPSNVTIMGQTDAMWLVYGMTRLLLMPSETESWGRTGCEALALGIPVLAADLPGLRESLSEGATFLPLEPAAWAAAIRALDDDLAYETAQYRAHTRGQELLDITDADLATWVSLVESL